MSNKLELLKKAVKTRIDYWDAEYELEMGLTEGNGYNDDQDNEIKRLITEYAAMSDDNADWLHEYQIDKIIDIINKSS